MANPEHLAILEKGVEAWNKWRSENPRTKPDLGSANLQEMDLSKANLDEVDLNGGYVSGATLLEEDVLWKARQYFQTSSTCIGAAQVNLPISGLKKVVDLVGFHI